MLAGKPPRAHAGPHPRTGSKLRVPNTLVHWRSPRRDERLAARRIMHIRAEKSINSVGRYCLSLKIDVLKARSGYHNVGLSMESSHRRRHGRTAVLSQTRKFAAVQIPSAERLKSTVSAEACHSAFELLEGRIGSKAAVPMTLRQGLPLGAEQT